MRQHGSSASLASYSLSISSTSSVNPSWEAELYRQSQRGKHPKLKRPIGQLFQKWLSSPEASKSLIRAKRPNPKTLHNMLKKRTDDWRAETPDQFLAQVLCYPMSEDDKFFSADDCCGLIKFFRFKDDFSDHDLHQVRTYLVPVRFMSTADKEVDISVRLDGCWVPLPDFLKLFIHPQTESVGLENRMRDYYDYLCDRGHRFNFMLLPAELRLLIYNFLMIPELRPYLMQQDHPVFGRQNYSSHLPQIFPIPEEACWSLIPTSLPFSMEANLHFIKHTKICFSEAREMEMFFGNAACIPVKLINSIREIELNFYDNHRLMKLFSSQANPDGGDCYPSFVIPVLRSMRDLKKITLHIVDRPLGNDPKWFDSVNPCRTVFVDTLLEIMFPWIYHVPDIELTGWVKTAQKEHFLHLTNIAKSLKIDRPTIDVTFMDQVISAYYFACNPFKYMKLHIVIPKKGTYREQNRWFYKQLGKKQAPVRHQVKHRMANKYRFNSLFIEGDDVGSGDLDRATSIATPQAPPPPCSCPIPCGENFFEPDDNVHIWQLFQATQPW
jgi:hypothetical protein